MREHPLTEHMRKEAIALEEASKNYRNNVSYLKMRGMDIEARQAEAKAEELLEKAKTYRRLFVDPYTEESLEKARLERKKQLFKEFQDEYDKASMYEKLAKEEQSRGDKEMTSYYRDKAKLHLNYAEVARGRLEI